MLKRSTGGLFGLAFLLGILGIGLSVGAASIASTAAQACTNGGYARYVDEDGDRFPDQQTCVTWIVGHPGESPLIGMAKLCSHGAHILYADDDGNPFTDEGGCLSWVAGHPGEPPVATNDDDNSSHIAGDGQPDEPPITTDEPDNADG